jgi:hypothetical protein
MTVRRIDSAQIKPGRNEDYFKLVREFADAMEPHGVSPVTVVRSSTGGANTGSYYAFADWESMEAYGVFMDNAVNDEAVMQTFGQFFAEDSPAVMGASNLLVLLASFGADEPVGRPGIAAIVRTWAPPPGKQSAIVDAFQQVAELYSHTNAHFAVGEIYAGGPATGNVMSAVVFPNMRELGAYVDDMRANPRIAEMIQENANSDAPVQMLSSGIVRSVPF